MKTIITILFLFAATIADAQCVGPECQLQFKRTRTVEKTVSVPTPADPATKPAEDPVVRGPVRSVLVRGFKPLKRVRGLVRGVFGCRR